MRASKITIYLEKIISILEDAELPTNRPVPLKLLRRISQELDTNKQLWMLIDAKLVIVAPILVWVGALIHSLNATNVPWYVQVSLLSIFVLLPVYRGLKLGKETETKLFELLIANALVTFISYSIGLFLAVALLVYLSPTPANLSFFATLPGRFLPLLLPLSGIASIFAFYIPYIIIKMYRNYNKANLENRSIRLEL